MSPASLPVPYYADSAVTLYHGDCRELLASLSADHAITDPPYETEAHTLQRRVKRGKVMVVEPLAFEPIDEALRGEVAELLAGRVRRWMLAFCQVEASQRWREALEAGGFVYRRTCIWVKPDGMPQYSGDRPGMGYETIVAMHAPGASRWNGNGRHGVFIVNKSSGGEAQEHPTTKPSALMTLLVGLFTDPGETVLDPFAGSGTTLRAAKDLGRKAIGIEIEERYCEIAARRCAQEVLALDGAA